MNALGIRLKSYREKYGYSQNQLSEKLHVSRQAISKWETNKARPDLETLSLLSSLYNISIDELLGNSKSYVQEESENNNSMKQNIPTPPSTNNKKEETFENLFFLVLAILSCSIPVLGIIIVVWILKNKQDSKLIKLIGILCIIINLYNTCIFANNVFLKIGYSTIYVNT